MTKDAETGRSERVFWYDGLHNDLRVNFYFHTGPSVSFFRKFLIFWQILAHLSEWKAHLGYEKAVEIFECEVLAKG